MENYHLFIDESGDPSLKSINHDFPIFALLGVLISDKEYEKLNAEFDRIKIKYFGSANVILHSRDIRKCDGVFAKLFDLKTITGKNSVGNRLSDSVEQTNRVLLNMSVEYNPSSLARSIKRYFEYNVDAKEVLIFKGQKQISITGKSLEDKDFFQRFIKRYHK